MDPADAVADLRNKRISAKLDQRFSAEQNAQAKGKCAIKCHEWSISNGRQQFLLSEREIDEIDICLADATYAFSIDAKFEAISMRQGSQ